MCIFHGEIAYNIGLPALKKPAMDLAATNKTRQVSTLSQSTLNSGHLIGQRHMGVEHN
jgi:hypothetical protein